MSVFGVFVSVFCKSIIIIIRSGKNSFTSSNKVQYKDLHKHEGGGELGKFPLPRGPEINTGFCSFCSSIYLYIILFLKTNNALWNI